jgi:hypothetical protein
MFFIYPCVLGSRILGGKALAQGMPWWKYVSNRALTAAMNLLMGAKLSEYHTGYRAFSRALLERLPLDANSDDFGFDAQMLAEILWQGDTIAEISCPTAYFPEASSINFRRSVKYGLECLATAAAFRLARWRIARSPRFPKQQVFEQKETETTEPDNPVAAGEPRARALLRPPGGLGQVANKFRIGNAANFAAHGHIRPGGVIGLHEIADNSAVMVGVGVVRP